MEKNPKIMNETGSEKKVMKRRGRGGKDAN